MSRKFPALESKLWRGVMWSPSYYVGTAGHVSAETIERYIREQQTEWKRGSSTRLKPVVHIRNSIKI